MRTRAKDCERQREREAARQRDKGSTETERQRDKGNTETEIVIGREIEKDANTRTGGRMAAAHRCN